MKKSRQSVVCFFSKIEPACVLPLKVGISFLSNLNQTMTLYLDKELFPFQIEKQKNFTN